jgi:HlyD family secretion protein
MDVKRDPKILKKKKIRRAIFGVAAAAVLVAVTVAVSRLEPAAPSVQEGTLWFGNVKRGDMVREVKGAGTLVPEDIRWVPARVSGRVERRLLQAGAQVEVGTAIIELDNPDLKQQMNNAELAWKSQQAQLENRRAALETQMVQRENAVANARSDYDVAMKDLEANKQLFEQGLVAGLTVQRLQATAANRKLALELAQKQLDSDKKTAESQLAPDIAQVNQAKATFDQLARQVSELVVRSPMKGQLQIVNVELGAQVAAGANVVRVSDPTKLKAEIRISETQTRDLAIGLPAMVDTRNGIVPGHVTRIDPASQGGTVGVDVSLDGPLPAGARPDLSVDGTVQLEKLVNILFVESPAFGQENSKISLFLVDPATKMATRTTVAIGRRSVQYVEVVEGLKEGDRVVLSDMSQYDAWNRIQIN